MSKKFVKKNIFLFEKNFGSEKNFMSKIFWVKKHFLGQQFFFGSKNIGSKKCWGHKKLLVKNFLGQKILSHKNFRFKIFFGSNKFLGQKFFESKISFFIKIWVRKIFCLKKPGRINPRGRIYDSPPLENGRVKSLLGRS